jgi:molybdopterin adenylyltransferase
MDFQLTISILIISDRAFQNTRVDMTAPQIVEYAQKNNWIVLNQRIVPDDVKSIAQILKKWCNEKNHPDIIFTSGGTGFSVRDLTPEATRAVIKKETPGISEFLRISNLSKNPHSILSRGVSGIRNRTLIINLPGNPKASIDNIKQLTPILPHAIKILRGDSEAEKEHQTLL